MGPPVGRLVPFSPAAARPPDDNGRDQKGGGGDETALTAEQLIAIEAALARAGVQFVNGAPVLTRANLPTPKSLLIVAPWVSAF